MRTLILTGPESESQRAVSRTLKQAFVSRGDTCLVVGSLELLGRHPSVSQRRAMEQGTDPAKVDPPEWRPFQLAFILMQLGALTNPTASLRSGEHEARVELLLQLLSK